MEKFILYSTIVHVIAGCLALLSGLGAIIFRNKIKNHRPFGKVYFWCMSIIFFTALYISVYRQNWFLLFIAVFTYYSAITAIRSLKLKKLHLDQRPKKLDWFIEILNLLGNLSLLSLAIILFINSVWQWAIICLIFSLIGFRGAQANIKRLQGKVISSNYWLLAHIGGMLGSYIGAITAFMVNNNRWMHLPMVVVWLGPAAMLVPLLSYELRKHRKNGKVLSLKS
ncbi:MAG: hypothetical protein ACJ76F_12960 [Bacteroidia bacterium]